MPQSPWSIVSIITQPMSPLHSTPNTKIMKISTNAVWPHITTNCVTTWENSISPGVTPATQLRSNKPSILSMINADDVNATAKKKTILLTDENHVIIPPYYSFQCVMAIIRNFMSCLIKSSKKSNFFTKNFLFLIFYTKRNIKFKKIFLYMYIY